jgi:hypothetical protein
MHEKTQTNLKNFYLLHAVLFRRSTASIMGGGMNCRNGNSTYVIIIFGGIQIFLSQLPSLDSISWLSVFSVATSVVYSTISLGICFAKWATHHTSHGTLSGATGESLVDKVTNIFLAIGTVAFTYAYIDVQIEIQVLLYFYY